MRLHSCTLLFWQQLHHPLLRAVLSAALARAAARRRGSLVQPSRGHYHPHLPAAAGLCCAPAGWLRCCLAHPVLHHRAGRGRRSSMAPSTWGTQTQQHLSAVSCSLAARVYNRPGTVSIRLMAQAAAGLVQQMAKDPRTPCSGLRLQPRRSSRTRGQFTGTASHLLHAHLVL